MVSSETSNETPETDHMWYVRRLAVGWTGLRVLDVRETRIWPTVDGGVEGTVVTAPQPPSEGGRETEEGGREAEGKREGRREGVRGEGMEGGKGLGEGGGGRERAGEKEEEETLTHCSECVKVVRGAAEAGRVRDGGHGRAAALQHRVIDGQESDGAGHHLIGQRSCVDNIRLLGNGKVELRLNRHHIESSL